MTAPALNVLDAGAKFHPHSDSLEGCGFVVGPEPVLVPQGDYRLMFVTWETHLLFGKGPKVCLSFSIVDPGEHFGKPLLYWCNAKALRGRPGKHGSFNVGRRSRLFLDYANLFGVPSRRDRLALTRFRSCVVVAKVRTVTVDYRQKPLLKELWYSTIDEFKSIAVGS